MHVGPLVVPPGQPCHTCATLAVRERDASAPVLAAQLVDAAPASESPTLAVLAATLAAQLIDAWGRGEARVHRSRVSVPAAQGRQAGPVEQHAVAPHPECACGVLGGGAGADGGTAVVAPATGPRAVRADRPLR
ncbi:hypothetical protein [Leucobacter chromiireducens]|uniref:hypothetical protein n=1 Tax=Leucobacter chromiireducens TaxID=283877 RepID=UPI0013DE3518